MIVKILAIILVFRKIRSSQHSLSTLNLKGFAQSKIALTGAERNLINECSRSVSVSLTII